MISTLYIQFMDYVALIFALCVQVRSRKCLLGILHHSSGQVLPLMFGFVEFV